MTKDIKYIGLSVMLSCSMILQAGNPERSGQAGAPQLLINPYARTSGMMDSNSAKARGLEAQFLNIAGTAFTRKTEIIFAHTNWLQGTGISVNAFGLTQGVGETGTIGFGVVTMNPGRIDITTEDQPEGGIGTFSPSFMNISLSYAKMFSDNIYGGVNFKLVNEKIPNASALGMAIDAGIQYHTGKYDQIHIGIALRNWGPKMKYQGDGLSRQMTATTVDNKTYQLTVSNRSNPFELPTQVNIGGTSDFYLTKDSTGTEISKTHRLSLNATFTSNSFTNDNGLFGIEYAWKEMLMVRAGLYTEKGGFSKENSVTAYTGPAASFTFELPFNAKKSTIGFDNSYRFSRYFNGIHSFGLRLNL